MADKLTKAQLIAALSVSEARVEAVMIEMERYKSVADHYREAFELYQSVLLRVDPSGGLCPMFDMINGAAVPLRESREYISDWVAKYSPPYKHWLTSNSPIETRRRVFE